MTEAELQKFALLAALGEADREAVAEELEAVEVEAGVPLFREGDRADGALFVAEGRVRVHSDRVAADAVLGAGEVLGTLSLVVEGPREANAETLSRVRIWRLSRSAYRRLVEVAPVAACRLLESILREYAGSVRQEVARSSEPPRRPSVDPVQASD